VIKKFKKKLKRGAIAKLSSYGNERE